MKLKNLYELAVREGKREDPRGEELILEMLRLEKERYEKLEERDKRFYDPERLTNPYADTRIFFGNPSIEVRRVMVGIDIEVGELVLFDRLREKGERLDAIITHHPEGAGLANLHELLEMQIDFFAGFGVPVHVAESLTRERQGEIARRISPANHFRNVDAARLLNIPFLGVHTPSDNHVSSFLQELFDKKSPRYVSEVVDILMEIPEYQEASRNSTPPFILLGRGDGRTGRICVDVTGGTEGSEEIYTRLSENGVGTVVAMHVAESHYKKARDAKINLVIAGHISSDNLGLNLLLDSILKEESLDVVEISGFRRVDRRQRRKNQRVARKARALLR